MSAAVSPSHEDPYRKYVHFVDGADRDTDHDHYFESVNPTTGRLWGRFAIADDVDVDVAVQSAHRAFRGEWSQMSASKRGSLMTRWGEAIANNADFIGRLEVTQNGKLLAEMKLQAQIALDWLRYFGGLADKIEGSVIPLNQTSVLNYTLREPLGVVGVITPWNSPTFLTIMSVAPALAAGNTVVLKPSEVTSASAIELARLAKVAGIPDGVINVVTGLRRTGEAIVDHPLVRKVAFTGSVGAGKAIAGRLSQRLASYTLELGGKSPNIVFPDANLDQAEAGVLAGIFAAAGQTCIAGSRAYIHEAIYDELVDRLTRRAKSIVLGDPLLTSTQMGPVATSAQLEKDLTIVAQARDDGAELAYGGERVSVGDFGGYFISPAILTGVSQNNRVMRNEVFGPVLAIAKFKDEDEVVCLANDSPFGLAAGVWTNDIKRGHRMARRLEAGTVWLNTYRALAFNSPFGGYKDSGVGRVNGIDAVNSFLQTKSVWCELGDEVRDPFVLKA
ncbi:aldehyde dehydrogenase [Rhizobium sp. C4]|uniref:aldehyde dehydrogenase n=1 Tax=Rhizobium sp. C4 TaxID=1349800 RepID=UPI001E2AB65B|nr:aldehyde dehydrogenase [Rhizobium sp. C4]MCD2175178.1 aldehyde dehydrogenase [Rhizobium sp. C4]